METKTGLFVFIVSPLCFYHYLIGEHYNTLLIEYLSNENGNISNVTVDKLFNNNMFTKSCMNIYINYTYLQQEKQSLT